MTVATSTNVNSYSGDGSTTAFPITYMFQQNADVQVSVEGSILVLGADYNLTGAGVPSGGTCTFTVAPAAGKKVVLFNNPALTQTANLVDYQTLLEATVGNSLDKLTILMQALNSKLNSVMTYNSLVTTPTFQGQGYEIQNIAKGTLSTSAARVDQIQAIAAGAGNVPGPLAADSGKSLLATGLNAFQWGWDTAKGVPLQIFNPDLTGATPSDTAVAAAIAKCVSMGDKLLLVPAGTVTLTGPAVCGANAIRFEGHGPNTSIIQATAGTFDLLTWEGSALDGGVRGIKFLATGMSGGNMLSVKQQKRFVISDCVFGNGYNGVYIEDQNGVSMERLTFQNQTGAYSIRNLGTGIGNANVLDMQNITIGFSTNTAGSPKGIVLDGAVATIGIRHCAVTKGYRGLSVENTPLLTGALTSFITAYDFESDFPYDSALYIDQGAGVSRTNHFTDCYFHQSQSSDNIWLGANTAYTSIKGGLNTGAYKRGVYQQGTHLKLTGQQIAVNSQAGSALWSGVELGAASSGNLIFGNLIGAWSGYGTELQSYGVTIDAGSANNAVYGNDLRGNVTGDIHDLALDAASMLGPNVGLATTPTKFGQPLQFTGAGTYQANGAVATALTSLGPTGSRTTVQKWMTVYDGAGNPFYVPCF